MREGAADGSWKTSRPCVFTHSQNRNMKKKTILLALCLAATWLGGFAQSNIIDEVIWIVGDEAIFKSEIEEYIQSERMQGKTIPADAYCKYAEELAVQKLFLHQAELDSVVADEERVALMANYQYEDMLNYYGTEEKLAEYMGKTPSEIKEKLLTLDDNTLVFPGHGPLSKIRIEKMFNQDILEANRLLNL